MATIKAYTTIKQSRKLAEILPLESADMYYRYYSGGMITGYGDCVLAKSFITGKNVIRENDLPCWSLAALLSVLPEIQGGKPVISLDDNYITYPHMSDLHTEADNLVDTCYELILKLKELNLL